MKRINSSQILIFVIVLSSSIKSQTFDMIGYFYSPYESASIIYNYSYEEFNKMAYSDSSIVLKSFLGKQEVFVENIKVKLDTVIYSLEIHKYGTEIQHTFYDTIAIKQISYSYIDTVFEINGISNDGANNHLYGWIFSDSLGESIVDTLDSLPMYPYSKLYRYYNIENDNSLYTSGDTLFIHERPKYVNYWDSYFSTDYLVKADSNLVSYARHYSYYGEGFREKYKLKDIRIVTVNDSNGNLLPSRVFLSQNYPNPFNPSTTMSYTIPVNVKGEMSNVKLVVYDVLGREVATLVNKRQSAGSYEIVFNASKLNSGVYFYQLQSGNFTESKKMILLK